MKPTKKYAEYKKKYREDNKEKIKKYRENNKEKFQGYRKKYRDIILTERRKKIYETIDVKSYEWKDVKGFEGEFKISSGGHIINLSTMTIIKLRKTASNYISVAINGKGKLLHRLLAEAFIPNPENKKEINHKNGIRDDNRLENLEWCTHQENIKHSFENLGRKSNLKGNSSTRNKSKGYYKTKNGRYYSQCVIKGKVIYLGSFDTAEEAAEKSKKYKEENNIIKVSSRGKGYTERNGRFIAQCNVKGKVIYLGRFNTAEEAIAKTKEYKESLQ